jgi:TolB protein
MHPEDSYPHWSPSGQSLVFHSALQGDGVDRLYIQWTGGVAGELAPVKMNTVPIMGRYPTWLPNWRIAYSGCDYWAKGSGCGIWTIDTKSGAGPSQLTQRLDDISNDAADNTLLYSSQASGNWDIYAIPTGGGNATNLTNSVSQEVGATFSPDGRSIAYISDRNGAWGIWVMNADGSNPARLLLVPGGFGNQWWVERLSWGP